MYVLVFVNAGFHIQAMRMDELNTSVAGLWGL